MIKKQRLGLYLIIIILIIINSNIALSENPENTPIKGYINDYANIISASDEAEIEKLFKELHDNNQAEVSIVTINNLNGMPPDMYAIELAHKKLGEDEKDNGLLYLIAIDDRKWRIEVGYGLEGTIPDLLAYRIGDNVAKNYFKNNQYSEGIKYTSSELYNILSDLEYEKKAKEKYIANNNNNKINIGNLIWIIFILFSIFGGMFGKHKKNKMDNDYFAAAMLGSVLFGKGGSGGFNGGGFGGFGGGGFGGGGAGGGW